MKCLEMREQGAECLLQTLFWLTKEDLSRPYCWYTTGQVRLYPDGTVYSLSPAVREAEEGQQGEEV